MVIKRRYRAGGQFDPPKVKKSDDLPRDKSWFDPSVDLNKIKAGVSFVESAGGQSWAMMNPYSSATGLYGQLYEGIKGMPELKGMSRKEFSKDLNAQNELFDRRFYRGFTEDETSPMLKDAHDLYLEYSPQLPESKMPSKEEIVVLSNFLGRSGTRKYLGYVLRDGMPLEKGLPDRFGPGAKVPNHTPEEYLKEYNEAANRYSKTRNLSRAFASFVFDPYK